MQKGSPPAAAALGSVQTVQTHGDTRRPDPIRPLRGALPPHRGARGLPGLLEACLRQEAAKPAQPPKRRCGDGVQGTMLWRAEAHQLCLPWPLRGAGEAGERV